jgi:hypothetical protein
MDMENYFLFPFDRATHNSQKKGSSDRGV